MGRPAAGFSCCLSLTLLACAAEVRALEAKPEPMDCRGCHGDRLALSDRTHHAGLAEGCYACHRGAEVHAAAKLEGRDAPAPRLQALQAGEANAVCQACHESRHATWLGSAHQRRGLRCTDCHSVHGFRSARQQLKGEFEPDTCYACHQAIRAQSLRTSHHPVREGLMTCGSCHDPHDGTRPRMIRADFTNELCFQCHTEKRGPFLWEHAPVRENCLQCHVAHGSNHDKLLVSQQPWLCQRCHLSTRHPGTLYSAVNSTGRLATASNRAVEHACKNCHQNVHGSNHPSGPYFGR